MKKVYLVQYKEGDFYENKVLIHSICVSEEKANEIANELFNKLFEENLKELEQFEEVEDIKEFSKPWIIERNVVE